MMDLILVGGGGHCISCIEVIESVKKYNIIGILEKESNDYRKVLNYDIIGTDELLDKYIKKNILFLITVGQIKNPKPRINLYKNIKKRGGKLATVIASTAYVSAYADIGEGSIIMHDAFVNAEVKIGRNCIINTKAVVEHESVIGDNSHISTCSVVNGNCKIGNNVFLGSNSVVNNQSEIKNDSVIPSHSRIIYDRKSRIK